MSKIMPGGWNILSTPEKLTKELEAGFEEATKEIIGVSYSPLYIAAKQVVAGMNYIIICKSISSTLEPFESLAAVKLYEDVQHNCKVVSIVDILGSLK